MKKGFYVFSASYLIGTFTVALVLTMSALDKNQNAKLDVYPKLSYSELTDAYKNLKYLETTKVNNAKEYFENLEKLDILEGSYRRAERDRVPLDPRYNTSLVDVGFLSRGFTNTNVNHVADVNWQEFDRLSKIYQKKKVNPLNAMVPDQVDLRHTYIWWLAFYLGGILLMHIHYRIKFRERKCKVWIDAVSNIKFWFAHGFWPASFWWYPNTTPIQQLVRARQFATSILVLGISGFAGAGKVSASEKKGEEDPKSSGHTILYNASTLTNSKFLGLDGAVFHPSPVQQSSISITFENGIYAGLWHSMPMTTTGMSPNFGNEIDVFVGWSGTYKGLNLSADAIYINVASLKKVPRGDLVQMIGTVGKTLKVSPRQTFKHYFALRLAVPVRGNVPIGGWFTHSGLQYEISDIWRFGISSNIELLRDSGAFGFKQGYIGRSSLTVSTKLRKGVTLNAPSFAASTPISRTQDGRKTEIVPGAGLAFSW